MNWKFWKKSYLGLISFILGKNDQGRTHKLKSVDELTPEEITMMRLNTIRHTLHHAVDKGIFDNNIRDIEEPK